MKKVYGSYLTHTEARNAVDDLLSQGYKRDEIKVISKGDLGNELIYREDDVERDDKSLWEKIKEAFTFDEYDDDYWEKELDPEERDLLQAHKINLDAGQVLVLVEEGANVYRDTFRDGVPDWDEREEEFNEEIDNDRVVRSDPNREDVNRANLGKNNLNRDNVGTVDIDLSNINESSLNKERDPLRDDDLSDLDKEKL